MNVIIVDDERNIREGIARLIDWEGMGCRVTGSFAGGKAALDYVREHGADIVITDIKMPGMDGLELARNLYEEKNPAKIIILTAYSDFDLAKQAIRYRVSDFIVKNEFIEELPAAVNKVISVIKKERAEKDEVAPLASTCGFKEELYKIVVTGESPSDTIIGADKYNCVICACEIDDYGDNAGRHDPVGMLYNIFRIALKDCGYELIPWSDTYIVIGVYYKKDSGIGISRLVEYFNDIIIMIEEFMRINVKFGLGGEVTEIAGLKRGYDQAKVALSGAAGSGSEVRIYTEPAGDESSFDVDVKINSIIEQTFDETENEAGAELCAMYEKIAGLSLSHEQCQLYMLVVCSGIIHRAVKYHLDVEKDFGKMERDVYEKIQNAKTIHSLLQIGQQTIDEIRTLCIGKKSFKNELVTRVDDCIREHYKEEINLQFISNRLFLSGSYVSRAYKKLTGYNVTEKITLYRINKAKELLAATNLKVYEIALEVGFKDAAYFTNVFMRYTGVSPSDFRSGR